MVNILKKILKLLNKNERRQLYLLFGAMVVSGFIEVVGIISILPFLSLITNPSLINTNTFLNWFYVNLKFQSTNRFLIFVGAIVLMILIISNLLILLAHWRLYNFSWMRNYTLSRRLLTIYLHQTYPFFLNKNTSELGKNILSEVQQAVKWVFVPLLEVLSRSIATFFIFITLIVIKPLISLLVIITLGGAYALIYRIVKNKISYIGKGRFKTNAERFRAVNECFGDIKQLKLLGCEKFFIDRYSKPAFEFSKQNATNQIIGEAPRYIMEIFAFGSIIVIVIYLLFTERGFEEILLLVGIFTFGAYRILPSLQKVFVSIAQIRFNIPALNVLYDDMYSFGIKNLNLISYRKKIKPIKLKKELLLENITFSYPEGNATVIRNLSLKIKAKTSVAFVGETGAGKTTVADIILGLLRPNEGSIIVDDIEITDDNLPNWQCNLGYIPQEIYLQDDTVARNIAFGIPDENIDTERIEYSAKIANIHNFVLSELPEKYDTKIGERGIRLSGGQRQRIGIARALYNDPGVLVLDEATSALDGTTEEAVFGAINNIYKTKTLIIIAHRLTTIKNCDVIYVIDDGKIIGQGKYDELIDLNSKFREMAKEGKYILR